MADLLRKQQEIIEKVTTNLNSKQNNEEGILVQNLEDYVDALGKINMPLVQQLLENDRMHWKRVAVQADKASSKVQSKIKKFLQE